MYILQPLVTISTLSTPPTTLATNTTNEVHPRESELNFKKMKSLCISYCHMVYIYNREFSHCCSIGLKIQSFKMICITILFMEAT